MGVVRILLRGPRLPGIERPHPHFQTRFQDHYRYRSVPGSLRRDGSARLSRTGVRCCKRGSFRACLRPRPFDLSQDLCAATDQHDYLGPGSDAASEVVLELDDVTDDLICTLGNRLAANSHSNGYSSVLGWLSDVVMKHQGIALKQIYAYPVIVFALLFQEMDCVLEDFIDRCA